ncbi:Uncharacterized protein APZ42_029586 [Daphnia magna]|uniref:Uncharacterized protein n=1 Tax=Daphnia magna TaxID=35525 RepID=A0A0N8A2Y6_9CRUS|nr:Uncharacterized protein APZ42_029586 [Daphnia magna]
MLFSFRLVIKINQLTHSFPIPNDNTNRMADSTRECSPTYHMIYDYIRHKHCCYSPFFFIVFFLIVNRSSFVSLPENNMKCKKIK